MRAGARIMNTIGPRKACPVTEPRRPEDKNLAIRSEARFFRH
jgi:hypothetical protein